MMKSRCNNPNIPSFRWYGARGIKVCDEWVNDFKAFYDWSMSHGYSDELTIDRIDNDKGYSPDNCRWVTMKIQGSNKSDNHIVTLNGVSKSLMSWCEEFNINYKTVRDRLVRGWSYEDALSRPVQTKFKRKVG